MKKITAVLFLCCFAFSFSTFSQDIIYKKDGSKEEVKVIFVDVFEIQYKKFDAPESPVYTLDKSNILLITYENGSYDVLTTSEDKREFEKINLSQNFARNVFSYHLFDLVFGDFGISYERILASGQVGLRFPVAIGFDEYNDINEFNNLFYSGVGVNFYPTGQGKWRYFMGPQLRFGYSRTHDWIYYYDENGNYLYDEEVIDEGFYTKFFVDNGIQFMPTRNFSISAIGSIGIRYFPEASYDEDVVRTDGQFAVNLSYRF
jgi:hypothetical protein